MPFSADIARSNIVITRLVYQRTSSTIAPLFRVEKKQLQTLMDRKSSSNNKRPHPAAFAVALSVNSSNRELLDAEAAKGIDELEVTKKQKVEGTPSYDTVSHQNQIKASNLLAKAIDASGIPLSLVDNPH